MMYGKAKVGGAKKAAFKPCPGCPNSVKCTAMGKCMKKAATRKK